MFTSHWIALGYRHWLVVLTVVILIAAALATSLVVHQEPKAHLNPDSPELMSQKPLTEYSPDEILAYRWQALADYHFPLTGATLQKPLTEYTAEEALAYRWQALANYYLKHGGEFQSP